jgi:hypothetical protein
MEDNTYLIYQVKEGNETRDHRFAALARLKEAGHSVEWRNYNHMYTGTLEPDKSGAMATLEPLFLKFNVNRPEDFTGRPLCISDVVVLHNDGKAAAYYVDNFGFKEVPEFLASPYKYYSTQRPIDIGTFPKTDGGPAGIVNFDMREYVENASFRAWGYIAYNAPLSREQKDIYELRAASDNPDHIKTSPYQLEARLQIIGEWEKAKKLPEMKRLTWWHPDFGVFVRKSWVTHEQVADCYNDIVAKRVGIAEKQIFPKPIAVQLAVAGKLVQRGVMPQDKKIFLNHEDR